MYFKGTRSRGMCFEKAKKLKRRNYLSYGPNQCWHIDGYDKLKPFGFPVHGAIDGFSRKVLWLEVTRSNDLPESVAKFYFEAVRKNKACPLQTCSDCGTENGIIAAAQCYFRSLDNAPFCGSQAHAFGTSPSNQRIENWWSHFRKTCSSWWVQFFKDLCEEKQLNLNDDFTKECLWFCFNCVLQNSFNDCQVYWNSHYIRQSHHETVAGVPNVLYAMPEEYGAFDCQVRVTEEKLQIAESNACHNELLYDNTFQDYFHYLVELQRLQYPENYQEASELFSLLMQNVCVI
ncbi:uncharacterized protein LOC124444760 [Xenia sp. Carnegie-2017]|uniref:uncharacterized protein LOC124444760 n=1 Tax=Xenia sp. Carnegie-2017 TaxID=2897299 RepID=UPI001F049C20|nr:uncharacterized protein LOC124444760 [Xenia sp. Carnegie-2017]